MILRITQLSDDYLSATKHDELLFSKHQEAPAIFKLKKRYYMITSGCTGWEPNKASLYTSSDIWGPWTYAGDPMSGPLSERTFGGQSTFVLRIEGKTDNFIFIADKWNPGNLKDSRYIWLPVNLKKSFLEVEWKDEWHL